MSTPDRVVVFCDWQNIYRRAREANNRDAYAPSYFGQVLPWKLGKLLTDRGPQGQPREFQEVRIYRGMPKQERDERGYRAARSQHAYWEQNNRVTLIPGRIQYPAGWPDDCEGEKPREKGVDVALAVDLVTMAVNDEFDVGIVFSADNDLLPAVEFVAAMYDEGQRHGIKRPRVEVAAWSGTGTSRRPSRLNPPKHKVWCHWLNSGDYDAVEDTNSYPLPTSAAPRRAVPRPPGLLG